LTRKIKIVLASIVALIATVAIAVTQYTKREGAHLQALRTDPMATYLPPGASQKYRFDKRGGGIALVGPTGDARIHRTVAPCDRSCYEATINQAQRVGWRITRQAADSSVLERDVEAGRLGLFVDEHDDLDPGAVGIWISFKAPPAA
jgi:hypothetical protein